MGTPPTVAKTFQNKYVTDVNAFFPSSTTVNVGDSVIFTPVGFHTANLAKKGGSAVPLIVPNGQKVAGALDAAGNPLWFNGQDAVGFNPALLSSKFGKKVTFNGTKAVNSGLPLSNKPKPMTVKFLKAGTFTYFCDVHPGMKGTVKVLAAGKAVPSVKAHAKKVATQVSKALAVAKNLSKTTPPAGTVDVGVAGKGGVEYFGMAPATTTVPVGTTLTFRMSPGTYEEHTATFGPGDAQNDPTSYLGKIAKTFEGATPDPLGAYPSEMPGSLASLTPTLHGNGFWNTGVMDVVSASPLPPSGQVTFGAAGTYTFYCLIHTNMKGTVVVQ